jgi:hypothetical protein
MDLVGTWKPIYRQATFGETPFHSVKENSMATIVINEDGTSGYMERKKMFGRVAREDVIVVATDNPDMMIIMPPETGTVMLAIIDEDGKLVTKWDSPIGFINEMCVVYERQ